MSPIIYTSAKNMSRIDYRKEENFQTLIDLDVIERYPPDANSKAQFCLTDKMREALLHSRKSMISKGMWVEGGNVDDDQLLDFYILGAIKILQPVKNDVLLFVTNFLNTYYHSFVLD